MICFFGKGLLLSTLLSFITTTSPFSISRINFAPIMSSAQVSEARINAFLNLPKTSGRIPNGSLAPINVPLAIIDKA